MIMWGSITENIDWRVFENRVVRRIFGPKQDEIIGGLRKLHNEFHNLCSFSNMIRMIK
jgi:hypothetical protein